jgi:hypothetical protein
MLANYCGAAIADAFGYATAFTIGAILALGGCLALIWVLDRYQVSSRVALAWRTGNAAPATAPRTSATEY